MTADDEEAIEGREARLFVNNRAQAVRIPAAWRYDVERVRLSRDGVRIIIEPIPDARLKTFFLDQTNNEFDMALPHLDAQGPHIVFDAQALLVLLSARTWNETFLTLAALPPNRTSTDPSTATRLREHALRRGDARMVERTEVLLEAVGIETTTHEMRINAAEFASVLGGAKNAPYRALVAAHAKCRNEAVILSPQCEQYDRLGVHTLSFDGVSSSLRVSTKPG